jgi:hypothetical protein
MANMDQVPKFNQKYRIKCYTNGQKQLRCVDNKCHKDGVVSYTDIATAITQRVYDYQFYFANFIATASTNPGLFETSLNQLMDVFSNDLTSYAIYGPDGQLVFPALTTKAQVRDFQQNVLHNVFQGFTVHTAPNVRVRPICNSFVAQASSGSGEIDYSLINIGLGNQYTQSIGYYNFTWKLESDGVWRIVTWAIVNKIAFNIPQPLSTTPVANVPYPDNPASNCC